MDITSMNNCHDAHSWNGIMVLRKTESKMSFLGFHITSRVPFSRFCRASGRKHSDGIPIIRLKLVNSIDMAQVPGQAPVQGEFSNRPTALIKTRKSFMDFLLIFCPPTAPDTLTLKTLKNALKWVLDWHSLGVNLDLKSHQLGTIEKNHCGDNERCRTEVLICWLDNTTTPTWEAVAEALDQMEQGRVADELRRKYISSTTTIEGTVLLY